MANIPQDVSQKTLGLVKDILAKDATTQGFNQTTGLTGYELEAPAKSLFPVLSPFRNSIPRVKATIGAAAAHWKAITAINTGNARANTGFGYAGNLISTKEQDFLAQYKVLSLGDTVQLDAQMQAQGFQDLRATSGINTLYALMMQEDKVFLGGQSYGIGAPSSPTLTPATTGGTIGAVNVSVAVAARTMLGYYDGWGTPASSSTQTGALTGSTNSVTASVTAKPGAVCYDWFVGVAGGNLYYYTTTSTNTIEITSVPTQAQSAPNGAAYAQLSAPTYKDSNGITQPITMASQATADNSGDSNSMDGLLSTLTGDYQNGVFVKQGSGAPTGSYFKSLDGASLTGNNGTINEIDAALAYLWANAKVTPTKILVNSIDHINISNKIIQSGGAYTMFRPNDPQERQTVIGGQLVETYLNKAVNGTAIPLETQPWLPQGTIALVTERLPYPNNKVTNVLECETQMEYTQFEYSTARLPGQANGGPRYDFEVRCQEVFKNYFPGSMAVIQNVANA